ncbi:MAG: DUF5916 domain-containing protein [Acidobacteriota bacterium]|nr:DUF5916 domain-containing protein [Acidobacteriota bacterium]
MIKRMGKINAHILIGVFGIISHTFTGQLEAISPPQSTSQNKKTTAIRIESPITIDGELNESEWHLSKVISDFVQSEPAKGEPGSELTEVIVLYDDENIYIGVYCFDSAGREGIVVNDFSKNYPPRDTDHFSVVLDTFDDDRNGFIFGVTPVGATREGQVGQDGRRNNFDWEAIWHVKTQITDQGWQVEMAIPFRSLRFREEQNQVWGINFARRIRRKNELDVWSLVPRPYKPSRVSLAGELHGISGIRQGQNLYVKPYLSAPLVRLQEDDVDFMPDVGLDVKYGLTPGLTLDLSANTDFSQVEADEQQINLTRFPLFFPEKREFFLENSSTFQVKRFGQSFRSRERDLIVFFSRRIGLSQGRAAPILGGARLTGTAGKYRLGFLSMQTREFEGTPSTNFTVARLRRDFLQNSDIGGIFINKQVNESEYNRTYGVDVNFQFFKYLEASSFVLKTDTPGLRGQDKSIYTFVGWHDPFYEIEGEYLSIEDNFNPEVGFVPRSGIRKSRGEFSIKPQPGKTIPWIRELRPSVGLTYITNQKNKLESRDFDPTLSFDLTDGGFGWFNTRFSFERLDEPFYIRPGQAIAPGDYQFQDFGARFTSDPSRVLGVGFFLRGGEFFDGHQTSFTGEFRFQPGYQLLTNISWTHDDIDLPSGEFTTNLVRIRANYSFNTNMSLKTLVQYSSTLGEITTNVRFNLIYKPLSDLFLVYNERRTTTGEVQERAIIAKLTYSFNF